MPLSCSLTDRPICESAFETDSRERSERDGGSEHCLHERGASEAAAALRRGDALRGCRARCRHRTLWDDLSVRGRRSRKSRSTSACGRETMPSVEKRKRQRFNIVAVAVLWVRSGGADQMRSGSCLYLNTTANTSATASAYPAKISHEVDQPAVCAAGEGCAKT